MRLKEFEDDFEMSGYTKMELLRLVYFGNGKYDRILEKYAMEVVAYFYDKGFNADYGNSRIAFFDDNKKFVYKIPRNYDGITNNQREQRLFKLHIRGEGWIPVARCKVFNPNPDIGLPILVMEKIEKSSLKGTKIPDWVFFVDCQQVGYDKNGKLVAYDV